MSGNTPEQQKRQEALRRRAASIVEILLRETSKQRDIVDRSYLFGAVALSALFEGHRDAAKTSPGAADEWLELQLRGFAAMLSEGPPARRVRITMTVEGAASGR